jgi:putative oxidoreductase
MANIRRIGHYSPLAISLFAEGEQGGAMTEIPAQPAVRSRSITASIVATLVALCAVIPYALVALGLRFVMARVFFPSGQTKIEELSIVLPAEIKASTFQLFETDYASLPIPPTMAAYAFTYAEFVLPVCLVVGFASRFAALGLLVMTVLMQIYVTPGLWWTTHIYWVSILMVLMSVGPGAISIDAGIRYLYSRE